MSPSYIADYLDDTCKIKHLFFYLKKNIRNNFVTYFFVFQSYAISERLQWIVQWAGQVVLCVSQIYWTAEVHEAIAGGLKCVEEYYTKSNKQLAGIVALVRGKLSKQVRVTLGALVVIDVHARDVVQDLIKNG